MVARAGRIVLPGQGAFGDCLAGLLAVDGLKGRLTEACEPTRRTVFGYLCWHAIAGGRGA